MCKLCETKPVYEFSNGRSVCARCFLNWFGKKFFYTIRKFEMIGRGESVGYKSSGDFRGAVLEHMLKVWTERAGVELHNNKGNRIAISVTSDLESYEIINSLIKGKAKKGGPVEGAPKGVPFSKGKIIKPLYLFRDEEVLLFAKLRRLRYKKTKENGNKISEFVDELEKKHPEVKHSIISSWLKIFSS
jgi:hypothetical protein